MIRSSIAKAMIHHPLQMMSVFTRRNVRAFKAISRESGMKIALSNMMRVLGNSAYDIERMNKLAECQLKGFTGEVVSIPCSDDPVVSVIIPVYNQFQYTYWCVRSIVDTVKDIRYEVIVADDCSTDHTCDIADYLPGVRVIRNEQNLRFTLNCNNAAKHARGRYLVFLNNDTVVHEHWLSSLLDLMESDPSIGLAGSKLIYPDGILQEAGSIVWRDGSSWCYGKGMNPALPEFNYVKDVDYISGASIMVRRDVWEMLRGFDERYAPAYCEDSDFAFEVRAEGYRTVYQPKSEVIHFEGISNGKAVTTKLKSYQIVNSRKFHGKWRDVLKGSHPHGVDLFVARDRSAGRKCVVFVDERITPVIGDEYDGIVRDAILSAAKAGMSVKLIADDFLFDDASAELYQQAGVEVLYGGEARKNIRSWVKSHSGHIDQCVICRPSLNQKYASLFERDSIEILCDARGFVPSSS